MRQIVWSADNVWIWPLFPFPYTHLYRLSAAYVSAHPRTPSLLGIIRH